jgi:hypothetical protein
MRGPRRAPWLALGGGGIAWTVHLLAGYFLVALGCPRAWPLGSLIAVLTLVAAAVSCATAVLSLRGRRRTPAPSDGGATALLYGAAALLAGFFTLAILLGGMTMLILPPCQGAAIGG